MNNRQEVGRDRDREGKKKGRKEGNWVTPKEDFEIRT